MPRQPILFTLVGDVLARWRDHRRNAHARHIITNLSPHLRKDIGWPDALPKRRRSPSGECMS